MTRLDILVFIFVFVISTDAEDVTKIQTCKVGEVVQNECLQCVCTSKHIYKCTTKGCNTSSLEKAHIIELHKPTCRPNMVYTTDTMTCICGKEGHWPHKKCEETFQTLNDTTDSCEANSYVILDCNVCRCSPEGKIDKERCTTNICENKLNTRRFMNNVYGSCEVKNWYSLAPCQFCFCVSHNKLVCNTGNNYSKKLDLGSYHLNVCGQGLIYEAIALIPDNDMTLRIGNLINTTVKTTPKTTTKYVKLQDNRNKVINVNKRNDIESTESDQKDKDESYSDSEDQTEAPKKAKGVAITQFPYSEEEDDTSKENSFESDKKEQNGMVIGEDPRHTPKKVMKTTQKIMTPPRLKQKTEDTLKNLGQNLGMTLKMSLPHMLDQMFKMALRKSMLSLKGDTKCVPGTTQADKCNMCFCMKNGKLLCTNNVCE